MKSVLLQSLILLLFSLSSLANGICIVDAGNGSYLHLQSSEVHVEVNNQIATITSRQVFLNQVGVDTTVKYGFPMSETASATSLRWFNYGQWFEADFSPVPQDTTLPGDTPGEPGTGTGMAEQIRNYLGPSPIYFDLEQIVPLDSILIIELTYVDLLPYAFNKVDFLFPNDYSTLQEAPLDFQRLNFTLESQRTIDIIEIFNHSEAIINNNGFHATISVEYLNTPATADYFIQYELNANELGLFDLSTFQSDTTEQCDDLGRGFFAFIIEPDPSENTAVIDKVFTFIIDESGSMSGDKIVQARDAASFIVNNLNEGDQFNIISFDSDIQSFRPYHVPYNLTNQNEALNFISDIQANGSTNISGAFETAIAQFANNDTELANIIIFFTDGRPNGGITDTPGILNHISNLISTHNVQDLSIFTFGIGEDVNKQLLNQIAVHNLGLTQFLEEEDLQETISTFYLTIQNPVLLNTEMTFMPPVITETFPSPLPNLFKGQQLIVVGRYDEPQDINVNFSGRAFGLPVSYDYQFSLADTSIHSFQFLPRLWSKKKMESLYNTYFSFEESSVEAMAIEEEIIGISICYGVISPFTSFVDNSDGGNTTEVEEEISSENSQAEFMLPAYPNPFSASVVFELYIPIALYEMLEILIMDINGKIVQKLPFFAGEAGIYKVVWEVNDLLHNHVPPGLYFCTLNIKGQILKTKIVRF